MSFGSRKFGSSKRFSEGEKREMQELMATKLQVSKDEWTRETEKIVNELKSEQEENANKEKISRQIVSTLRSFAKENRSKLATHAHGMITTSHAIQLSVEESSKDLLTKLHENFVRVLARFEKILAHRELLLEERERCLKILNVDEKNDLSGALSQRLMLPHPPSASNGHVVLNGGKTSPVVEGDEKDKDRMIKRLNKKIADLEHEIQEKEEYIQRLQDDLTTKGK